jgi:hypothetical protein
MGWELIAFLNAVFAISAALLWSACSGPKKSQQVRKGAIRQRRDEFDINPADVPQFKPTWPGSQY